MGDDSQHDPFLYERVVKVFPKSVKAIYIRQTTRKKKKNVKDTLANIEDLGVATCYFKDSHKAIKHSRKIGIL